MSNYKDNEEIIGALDIFNCAISCMGNLDNISKKLRDTFEEGNKEKFEQFVKGCHKLFSVAESNLSNILHQLQNEKL